MKIITKRDLIREVANRWRRQFPPDCLSRNSSHDQSKANIQAQLDALDLSKVSAARVNKITGNDSWTTLANCCECGKTPQTMVIELGEEPDYESNTTWLCPSCLERAYHEVRSRLDA